MSSDHTYCFGGKDIGIEKSEVYDMMRLDKDLQVSLSESVDTVLNALPGYQKIKGRLVVKPVYKVSMKEGSIAMGNLVFHTGKSIASFLKHSEYLAVFVCTAGDGIESLITRYREEGDLLKSYISDLTGTLLVEKAMDLIQKALGDRLSGKGIFLTNRYSPGYCDWDTLEQHKLFSLLPGGSCGVTLNASALMSPMKSISGIIGIGEKVKFHRHDCEVCKSTHCIYRTNTNKTFL